MNDLAADYYLIAASLRRDHVFWVAMVLLIASGFYLTYWAYRKRRWIWRKFAALHGLAYEVQSAQPRVHGKVDGRDFAMLVANRSSDRGLFGIELIEMQLSMDTGVAKAFDITNEGAAITALRESAGDEEVVHVSTDEFDQRTCSHADDSAALREFLTDDRRAAILKLIDECAGCDIHVSQTEIKVTERTMVKSIEGLTQRLTAMRRAARGLDAAFVS